jgi:subtilisin-like proprotein convertase family protein
MLRSTRIVSLAAAALALVAISKEAQAQCVVGGAGGTYGTDTLATAGVWDTTLPGSPLVSTLAVTVPSGATVLNSVVLRGLSHTWGGDTHVILESPAGQQYNVLVVSDDTSPGGGGCGDVLGGGDYTIVDAGQAAGCGGAAVLTCGTGLPAGTYAQSFSNWTSGGAGVLNTPLEQIPLANGTWTLYVHDWYPPLDSGSLASWEMCFGSPTPPPPGGGPPLACVTGGAGGFVPQTGAVDGTWPTVLPTGQLTSTLAVTIPAGSTTIKGLKLNGLSHTWLGDCQIVLTSPSGINYNIFQEVDGNFGGGCATDFAGDYIFVDPVLGTDNCGNPATPFVCTGALALTPGYYGQYYGAWTSGDAGIVNVNLESIPPANGTWTLSIYDWYVGADAGSLTSWDLCFDSGASTPTAYCTAGTTTNGCNASITATAQPSVTFSTACVLNVANVEGQKQGLIFYGVNNTGFSPTPWGPGSTSFLCVKSPTQRSGTQTSGGLTNSCTGAFTLDWNVYQGANPGALGNPFSAGAKVYAQGWFRDPPAPKTTNLSNAVEMTVVP